MVKILLFPALQEKFSHTLCSCQKPFIFLHVNPRVVCLQTNIHVLNMHERHVCDVTMLVTNITFQLGILPDEACTKPKPGRRSRCFCLCCHIFGHIYIKSYLYLVANSHPIVEGEKCQQCCVNPWGVKLTQGINAGDKSQY